MFRKLNDREGIALILMNRMLIHAGSAYLDRALDRAREAQAALNEYGLPQTEAHCHLQMGVLLFHLGRYDESLMELTKGREQLQALESLKDVVGQAMADIERGRVLLDQGALEEAKTAFEQALATVGKRSRSISNFAHFWLGRLYLASAEPKWIDDFTEHPDVEVARKHLYYTVYDSGSLIASDAEGADTPITRIWRGDHITARALLEKYTPYRSLSEMPFKIPALDLLVSESSLYRPTGLRDPIDVLHVVSQLRISWWSRNKADVSNLLQLAHDLLLAVASRIENQDARTGFLRNQRGNARLLEEWEEVIKIRRLLPPPQVYPARLFGTYEWPAPHTGMRIGQWMSEAKAAIGQWLWYPLAPEKPSVKYPDFDQYYDEIKSGTRKTLEVPYNMHIFHLIRPIRLLSPTVIADEYWYEP